MTAVGGFSLLRYSNVKNQGSLGHPMIKSHHSSSSIYGHVPLWSSSLHENIIVKSELASRSHSTISNGHRSPTCKDQRGMGCDAGASLQDLQQRCSQIIWAQIEGYIWQRDSFHLQFSEVEPQPWHTSKAQAAASCSHRPACLWGQTCYGDNVEDEWFIVWLLMELTRQLPVTARIWDSDGDFLLTEAAYVLPE